MATLDIDLDAVEAERKRRQELALNNYATMAQQAMSNAAAASPVGLGSLAPEVQNRITTNTGFVRDIGNTADAYAASRPGTAMMNTYLQAINQAGNERRWYMWFKAMDAFARAHPAGRGGGGGGGGRRGRGGGRGGGGGGAAEGLLGPGGGLSDSGYQYGPLDALDNVQRRLELTPPSYQSPQRPPSQSLTPSYGRRGSPSIAVRRYSQQRNVS